MSHFIKLTKTIINIYHIQTIIKEPNKYYINLVSNNISGISVSLFGNGIGTIDSDNNKMEVCENKHKEDYKILKDWIDNQCGK